MRRLPAISFATIFAIMMVGACREITSRPAGARVPEKAHSLINPSGTVVVLPENMRGWVFYNDQTDAACADSAVCRLVDGPGVAPLGTGSAELAALTTSDGKALVLPDYANTRFDHVTSLRYSTYRQTQDTGNNLAMSAMPGPPEWSLTPNAMFWPIKKLRSLTPKAGLGLRGRV